MLQQEVGLTKEKDCVDDLFIEVGIDVKKINPNIVRKLRLLNKKTQTFKDEERAVRIAKALFQCYEKDFPDNKFSDQEMRTVLIGTIFTDIGKTGPRNATPEQEEVVANIYAIETVMDPMTASLKSC